MASNNHKLFQQELQILRPHNPAPLSALGECHNYDNIDMQCVRENWIRFAREIKLCLIHFLWKMGELPLASRCLHPPLKLRLKAFFSADPMFQMLTKCRDEARGQLWPQLHS